MYVQENGYIALSIFELYIMLRTFPYPVGVSIMTRLSPLLLQVLYYRTGRFVMVAYGFIAFFCMSVGMWMFTIASPFFYWFGAPTLFTMIYLFCHCK